MGVEALAGIPGLVGATPIQNVGAYGQEVAQTIASVRVWDRVLKGVRTFANADCGFGYRTSRFKADPGRHVVLDVTFQLSQGTLGTSVQYAELAAHARRRARRARTPGRRTRRRPRPAPQQGDGPRPGRPRHLERGLVLHQPGRGRHRGAVRRPRLAAARRPGQDQRGLADRARRASARGTAPRRSPSPPSTRSRSPTAAAPPPSSCSRWPARSATASRPRTASGWSPSRCWSAASSRKRRQTSEKSVMSRNAASRDEPGDHERPEQRADHAHHHAGLRRGPVAVGARRRVDLAARLGADPPRERCAQDARGA